MHACGVCITRLELYLRIDKRAMQQCIGPAHRRHTHDAHRRRLRDIRNRWRFEKCNQRLGHRKEAAVGRAIDALRVEDGIGAKKSTARMRAGEGMKTRGVCDRGNRAPVPTRCASCSAARRAWPTAPRSSSWTPRSCLAEQTRRMCAEWSCSTRWPRCARGPVRTQVGDIVLRMKQRVDERQSTLRSSVLAAAMCENRTCLICALMAFADSARSWSRRRCSCAINKSKYEPIAAPVVSRLCNRVCSVCRAVQAN